MLDAEARPTQVGLKRVLSYEEVDVFAAIKSNYTPQGIGELLRPRQHVVDPFAEALCEGGKACPLYVPFLLPELGELRGLLKTQLINKLRKRAKLANVDTT